MTILVTGGPADGHIKDQDLEDPAASLAFLVNGEHFSKGHYNLMEQLPRGSAAEWRAQ